MKRPAIRTMIRNRLGDLDISAYEWSDAQLNDFIDRAFLEYSQHFPLWGQATIASDDGSHEFDLPMGCRSVLRVEYPASQVPPVFLERRERSHPDFYLEDGYYDLVWKGDETTTSLLIVSNEGAAGTYISVEYTYDHPALANDTTDVTVDQRHMELVVLFVRLCVLQERASEEAANPDPTTLILSTIEMNVERAERIYQARLKAFKESAMESRRTVWRMDKWDGGYS